MVIYFVFVLGCVVDGFLFGMCVVWQLFCIYLQWFVGCFYEYVVGCVGLFFVDVFLVYYCELVGWIVVWVVVDIEWYGEWIECFEECGECCVVELCECVVLGCCVQLVCLLCEWFVCDFCEICGQCDGWCCVCGVCCFLCMQVCLCE